MADRVVVAMSGGVDSAVAAARCVAAGDDVVGISLRLVRGAGGHCCSLDDFRDAQAVADRLGFPHYVIDAADTFAERVVAPFVAEYLAGRTPNPCARCNEHVKFGLLWQRARELGAARLATGHYARIARDEHGPLIRTAADPRKDQSYMLAKLDPAQLDRLSFPLGGLTKDAVRQLARDAGLPVADKRESQDLCFVAGLGGRAFLRRHGGPRLRKPGEIVDPDGRVLGHHEGQHEFTVGQRRGLDLSGPEPLYVLRKEAASNRVTVGPKSALATRTVRIEGARLHRPAEAVQHVRLRYHARPLACRATPAGDGTVELELAEPAEAVAPGQQACLMSDDCVVGEGTIV
jgi:tRNA-uridine 2-sulfurtransferase